MPEITGRVSKLALFNGDLRHVIWPMWYTDSYFRSGRVIRPTTFSPVADMMSFVYLED